MRTMTVQEEIAHVINRALVSSVNPFDEYQVADAILALLHSRGWTNDPVALSLLDQAKKLRKVCPECEGAKTVFVEQRGWTRIHKDCPTCHGTGSIPVEAGNVEVRVK